MSILDSVRFYIASQYLAWKTLLSYRMSSILWLIYSSFNTIYTFVFITLVYTVSNGIIGWNYYQMLILSSSATLAISIIYYHIEPYAIISRMRNGKYDFLFTKPYGLVTIMLSTSGGSVTELSGVISSLIIFFYAASKLNLSIIQLSLFFILFFIGLFAILLFLLMITVLSYYAIKSGQFINSLVGLISTAANYPLNIYGPILSLFFTVFIPIGLAIFYPASIIFGKITIFSSVLVIVLSVIISIVSYKLFYFIIKRYSSGGG